VLTPPLPRIVTEGAGDPRETRRGNSKVEDRDGPRVRDEASVAVWGLRRGLNLFNGVGQAEFASAHDPMPAGARADPTHRGLTGDPFDEPGRPLVLTLASDCAELPERVVHDLLSLSRFPGVIVSTAPGVSDQGFPGVLHLTWNDEESVIKIEQVCAPGTGQEDAFAQFDGAAPTRVQRPRSDATAFPQPGIVENAGVIFDAPDETARRVAREAIAHKGIGNDYIVSPTLVRGRRIRHAGWPNELGACTPDEAFALAGLKTRMYASVPLVAEPDALVLETTGLYRDLSVTKLSPRLWRVIGAALGPAAAPDEARCADRLLAIRERLADLLVARDEILRLARRDALGTEWIRPFDRGPVAGAQGGEVVAHLAYHTMAALNALNSVADNLAWIARVRSGEAIAEDDTSASLSTLAGGRRRGGGGSSRQGEVPHHLEESPSVPCALSLLRMRNAFAHRAGVDYGVLSTETMTIPPTRNVAAIWVRSGTLGPAFGVGTSHREPMDVLRPHATFAVDSEFIAFTFPDLIRLITRTAFALTNDVLCRPRWRSPRAWLLNSSAFAKARLTRRAWRPDLQRRLWDLPRWRRPAGLQEVAT
jgi:hypothetical protein